MDMRPAKDISQRGHSAHLLLADLVGLHRQGAVRLHSGVGQPLLLTRYLGLHPACSNIDIHNNSNWRICVAEQQ